MSHLTDDAGPAGITLDDVRTAEGEERPVTANSHGLALDSAARAFVATEERASVS